MVLQVCLSLYIVLFIYFFSIPFTNTSYLDIKNRGGMLIQINIPPLCLI